jgi:hypothetical protein
MPTRGVRSAHNQKETPVTVRPYADAARQYWAAGWANPIPVKGKWPPPTGYTGYDGATVSWPDVQAWLDGDEAGHNIALRLPGDVVGIDVDAYDGKIGAASLAAAEEELGPLPATFRSTSRAPFEESGIRLYRVPAGTNLRGAEKRFRARFGDHVDIIRRDHRYTVVWPSVHPETGVTYQWYGAQGDHADIPRPQHLPELPAAWVEFLTIPADQQNQDDSRAEPGPSMAGSSPWDLPRQFTREQATDFVRPHFEALRAAPEGTINNRLNDAAFVLSHFVPTFWSRAEATRWLLDALNDTAYDGKTWRAESTIASGLSAPGWRAELLEPGAPGETTPDQRAEALAREVARLHFAAEAKEIFAAERHARTWSAPEHHGTLEHELQLPEEEERWRLQGLLGVGHNAVLVASRKAGKTTMINNLIKAYVDGEAFLGRFDLTPADATVAVFNYEVDQRQYRRWLREVGITNTSRVFVLHLRGRSLPLKDARVRTWVARWLRERGVGLWVVDPYSRAYVGSLDNGNDEAQVGTFLDTLDVIKADAGVSELVMPVHTPKGRADAGEESAIGSQRLEGWPDSMWYLTRDVETGLRFLRAEGRDVDVAEEQLTYDTDTRRLTLGGWNRATLRQRSEIDDVVAFVRQNPGCSQNDITRGMGWGVGRTQRVVQAATGSGELRFEPTQHGNGRAHYANS